MLAKGAKYRKCSWIRERVATFICPSSAAMPIVEVLAILQVLSSGTRPSYLHGVLTAIGRQTEEENMAMARKREMQRFRKLKYRSPIQFGQTIGAELPKKHQSHVL